MITNKVKSRSSHHHEDVEYPLVGRHVLALERYAAEVECDRPAEISGTNESREMLIALNVVSLEHRSLFMP